MELTEHFVSNADCTINLNANKNLILINWSKFLACPTKERCKVTVDEILLQDGIKKSLPSFLVHVVLTLFSIRLITYNKPFERQKRQAMYKQMRS